MIDLREKLQNSCLMIQRNHIEIFRDNFYNKDELQIAISLQKLSKMLNLEDKYYNEAISFLANLLSSELPNLCENLNEMQKQYLTLISTCFRRGFHLNAENYEIYLDDICEIPVKTHNSREVLLFFINHQPGNPLPSFQEMREKFPAIPPKPSSKKEFNLFTHAVSFFLDFMELKSQKMDENIKKNKHVINIPVFQTETINLMVKLCDELFKEKIRNYELENKVKENKYTSMQVGFYEKYILEWCETIQDRNQGILEYFIQELQNFPHYLEVYHKFHLELDEKCRDAVDEIYNFLSVVHYRELPKELRYHNREIEKFQKDAIVLIVEIGCKLIEKSSEKAQEIQEENMDKRQIIKKMMGTFLFDFE